jgi:hypothetical protein
MYADSTLTPKEAARLCALGTLSMEQAMTYAALAASVRHFLDRAQGPSLDVLGSSLELLKYEGLVETDDSSDETVLSISDAGQRELIALLSARLRPGATDTNKLIVALKFRFLHLLDVAEQRIQVEMMLETIETEMVRLMDLRSHHAKNPGYLMAWLDREINDLSARAEWLNGFKIKML